MTFYIVTDDTDLAHAVKCAQKNFKDKEIIFAFTYKWKNEELADL